jgi:hypothetical protein
MRTNEGREDGIGWVYILDRMAIDVLLSFNFDAVFYLMYFRFR